MPHTKSAPVPLKTDPEQFFWRMFSQRMIKRHLVDKYKRNPMRQSGLVRALTLLPISRISVSAHTVSLVQLIRSAQVWWPRWCRMRRPTAKKCCERTDNSNMLFLCDFQLICVFVRAAVRRTRWRQKQVWHSVHN